MLIRGQAHWGLLRNEKLEKQLGNMEETPGGLRNQGHNVIMVLCHFNGGI
jgi:hypothetical protein